MQAWCYPYRDEALSFEPGVIYSNSRKFCHPWSLQPRTGACSSRVRPPPRPPTTPLVLSVIQHPLPLSTFRHSEGSGESGTAATIPHRHAPSPNCRRGCSVGPIVGSPKPNSQGAKGPRSRFRRSARRIMCASLGEHSALGFQGISPWVWLDRIGLSVLLL